jgi:hypothetical protein
MLSVTSGSVVFGDQFTVTIEVLAESTGGSGEGETPPPPEPTTEIPEVTASFTDSGVTVTPAAGKVTISGKYTSIFEIPWTYINLQGAVVTSITAPEAGTYKKITSVQSPSVFTKTCTYTIAGESFVHTVTLGSYTTIANKLKSLLAGAT